MEDKNLKRFFKSITTNINMHHIPAHASSAAFFVFLSIIPIMILLFAIVTYTPLDEEMMLGIIEGILPTAMEGFVTNVIGDVYGQAGSYLSIAIIAVVWSAARGILSIMTGLNVINDSKKKKNYLILRLWASIYTIILVLSLIILMILMIFGGVVLDVLMNHLSQYFQIMYLVATLRFAVAWIIMVFIFLILYAKVPNVKMKLSYQLPGALFTATMWSLFSYIFSLYVDGSNAFSMYGSLTTLIVILLWLYFNMQFLFYGAEINHYLMPMKIKQYERRENERKEKKEFRRIERELVKKDRLESKKEKKENIKK